MKSPKLKQFYNCYCEEVMLVVGAQMHLVELLLQAEKKAKCTTPVNCYRKYLGIYFQSY